VSNVKVFQSKSVATTGWLTRDSIGNRVPRPYTGEVSTHGALREGEVSVAPDTQRCWCCNDRTRSAASMSVSR